MQPEPLLTVSQWADRHRVLSSRAAAEPGPWRTDRTPYLREIMDALSPSDPTERVVLMKGAQTGGTEAGNCWVGYVIHQAPGPMMAVLPTVETAKRASRQRIEPLIEESPALRGLVRDPRARDSGNTVLSKLFPGGVLIMTGANSAVGLRSMPVRYLFLDEVDAFPPDADNEGDPVALAVHRTATFARRKIFMVSTPTIAGLSRIEAAFEESDKRRYWVPCPDCGGYQVLTWLGVRWTEGDPSSASYACEHCGVLIPNHRKPVMLARGEWRAEATGDGRTAGFHLSGLYSPWRSWGECAAEFLAAKGSDARMKSWTNLTLGESWTEPGEAPAWQKLYDRRERYEIGTVPEGALFLTAGVDVQRDRLEAEVVGWGPNRITWSVDYLIFAGDTASPAPWRELSALLSREFPHALGGALTIGRLAIDSGFATQAVYAWARVQPASRVMVVKGSDKLRVALGPPAAIELTVGGKRAQLGLRLWHAGVSVMKEQLYGWLRLDPPAAPDEPPPEGLCHFPDYGREFFEGLTAERQVRRATRSGAVRVEWLKARERNEPLDCRIYAMAAAQASGIHRWSRARWDEIATTLKAETPPPSATAGLIRSRWLDG